MRNKEAIRSPSGCGKVALAACFCASAVISAMLDNCRAAALVPPSAIREPARCFP